MTKAERTTEESVSQTERVLGAIPLLTLGFWTFLVATDYSLRGTLVDYLVSPFALAVGVIYLRKKNSPFRHEYLRGLDHIARRTLVVTGCLPVCLSVWALTTLPVSYMAFWADAILNETRIQSIASPDRQQYVDVYYRDVVPHPGAVGEIDIRLRNKWVPFLERDIYSGVAYDEKIKTQQKNYVKWVGGGLLLIGGHAVVNIGPFGHQNTSWIVVSVILAILVSASWSLIVR